MAQMSLIKSIVQERKTMTDEKIQKRKSANKDLLRLIGQVVDENPHLRFHQILHVIGIEEAVAMGYTEDKFGEESVDTLKRVMKNQYFQ